MDHPFQSQSKSRELSDAVAVAEAVVWATVTTVDPNGRPRARVLHPVWDPAGDRLDGWILTRPTPVKTRHLAANPNVTVSYLGANHDLAHFDCTATWVDDPAERRRVWEWVASIPPPVGYDPATIFPSGPTSENYALLRLQPYRVQVGLAVDLARGERPRVWSAERSTSGMVA
jgi:hypothetical protein